MGSDKPWWQRFRRWKNGQHRPVVALFPIVKVNLPRLLLFCVTFAAIWWAMTPPSLLVPVPFVVGDTFPYDIRAYRTVRYLSETATERRRQMVAAAMPRQYRRDPSVAARWEAVLNELMETLRNWQTIHAPLSEKVNQVERRIGIDLPEDSLRILLQTSPTTLQLGKEVLLQKLRAEWQRGIRPTPEDQATALQRVKDQLARAPFTREVRVALEQLAAVVLQPNMVFDPIATELARAKARESVEPVWQTIVAGELIARKGELVTEEHIEKLRALGYNFPALIGITLLSLLLTFALALFLRIGMAPIYADLSRLGLLCLLWVPGMLLVRFLYPLTGVEVAFVVAAGAGMLTAMLVNPLVSVLASLMFALITSLGMSTDWQSLPTGALRPLLLSGACGMAASLLSGDVRTRAQLVRVGLVLFLLTFSASLVLGLVTGEIFLSSWGELQRLFLWSAVVGFVPPAVTLAGVGFLERPFGVVSVFTLTELANPNTPLLRELAEQAPGTFQSSLIVARLAQEAARRIGANDLLAWVGGLYHDIGKLTRPEYFVENQPSGTVNPHSRLGPRVSALILGAHVRDGIELAKRFRLPQPVVDIIAEHHGTSVMTYFWAKAHEQCPTLVESDYRYRGPKPRSKESAIILLADSVEAAVRALPNPDLERVREVIDSVVAAKIADGQLDESPLSFRDVQEIKQAFFDTFKSIYHQRIEYPRVERHGKATAVSNSVSESVPSSQRAPAQTSASD